MDPIEQYVRQAIAEFNKEAGFMPERIHVSRLFEHALHRWAHKHNRVPVGAGISNFDGATFLGLEVLKSTKLTSPHFEFWLSTERDRQVYHLHVRLVPEDFGLKRDVSDDVIHLRTEEADYDTE